MTPTGPTLNNVVGLPYRFARFAWPRRSGQSKRVAQRPLGQGMASGGRLAWHPPGALDQQRPGDNDGRNRCNPNDGSANFHSFPSRSGDVPSPRAVVFILLLFLSLLAQTGTMKPENLLNSITPACLSLAAGLLLAGCASNGEKPSGGSAAAGPARSRFIATDGRTIDIGKSSPADGGTRYNNPHMEKEKCWVAGGFDFNGYDTLYIAPTLSTAKFPDKPEDTNVHELAKKNLPVELARMAASRNIFGNVVTQESEIKPGAKVLKLENTITEFSKGGGAGRYFAGLYGGGQPVLRVQGRMNDGDKTVFTFEIRRSGTSGGARMGGAFMKDEDIQIEDIRSMALDLSDFMAAVARKYQPKP